jgi:tetratricopeptide (TPR) repeat protein
MRLDEDTYDRIMSYLNGEMTTTEKNDFERDLQNDLELNETVSIMQNMDTIYNDKDWHVLKNEPERIKEAGLLFNTDDVKAFSEKVRISEDTYKRKDLNKKRKIVRYMSSIAAVGLIAFFFNYYLGRNVSSESLFNTYYSTQDLPSFVVQNNDVNTTIEAETLFREEKYQDALQLFSTANETSNTLNPNITLYIAMCNLELKRYDTALNYLEALENSNTIDFHKAYWFESLIYLKQDQKDKAIQSLKVLSENSNYFNHEKAVKLLRQLE